MENSNPPLKYYPFSSNINPSFWQKFTELKLDVDKLEVTARTIWGSFANNTFNSQNPLLEVDSTSFNLLCQSSYIPAYGILLNKNTIEEFKECDKNEVVKQEGLNFWDVVTSRDVLEKPYLLNQFFILSFADLKKYHYYYWFCFLAPKLEVGLVKTTLITDEFNAAFMSELHEKYQTMTFDQKPFFIIKINSDGLDVLPLQHLNQISQSDNCYFAFSDPSQAKLTPGWPLRNYIALLMHHCPFLCGRIIKTVGIRVGRSGSIIHLNESAIWTLQLPNELKLGNTWIGWEKNETGKFCPRFVNMKAFLDPKILAETSVDLNLKLMKWHLVPYINLDKIKHTKCLLLGSGTLGCSVARTLLGWGIRHITFVDNSTVSYSNPVRQSLFNYEDCVKNRPKALAAAENLMKIFPGVKSAGHDLSIPMPGHPIGETLLSKVKEDVERLKTLIQDHEVIFLLMDSRESRWLPTLMGMLHHKIVINAALGFDSYLVMRHGVRSFNEIHREQIAYLDGLHAIHGTQLGCYFCNDVTAPGNSLKHRTLDQQCTVTRPGISPIAGALAAELAISVLQHPLNAFAPAFYSTTSQTLDAETPQADQCVLGILPHSIRGFLYNFTHVLPATERYKQCVACSEKVLLEYNKRGFAFLLEVFESSKHLEELTGLADMQKDIADLEVWDFDEDSSGTE